MTSTGSEKADITLLWPKYNKTGSKYRENGCSLKPLKGREVGYGMQKTRLCDVGASHT